MEDLSLSQNEKELLKHIVITQSSLLVCAHLLVKDGSKVFGGYPSDKYKKTKRDRLPSLLKSYASYQRGSHKSTWVPLELGYTPLTWLIPHPLLRALTPAEHTAQSVKGTGSTQSPKQVRSSKSPKKKASSSSPPPARQNMSSNSRGRSRSQARSHDNEDSSTGLGSIVIRQEDAGFPFIVGTLEIFLQLDPAVVQGFCDSAPELVVGKNMAMHGLWLIDEGGISIDDGGANVHAIAITFFEAGLRDYELYRLGFGGPDNQFLFLQMPSFNETERTQYMEVVATLQDETIEGQSNDEKSRKDGYGRIARQLHDEKTRVSSLSFFATAFPVALSSAKTNHCLR